MRIANRRSRAPVFASVVMAVLLVAVAAYAIQNQGIDQKLTELSSIEGKFSFVVLGDVRSNKIIYKRTAIMTMALKPDFVVSTGDSIQTPGDREEWMSFWTTSRIITAPYFLTVGNHDISPLVPASEKEYREQVDLPGNELYYSFTVSNALFIVLDSYMAGQERRVLGDQLRWLKGVLAKKRDKHVFVFVHHPFYTEYRKGRHPGDCLDKYPEDRDRLEAILAENGVDAVFSGHEHFYQRKTVDGIEHIITGGAGAPLYVTEVEGGFYHFIHVTVDGDQVSAEVIDRDGKVRDRFRIHPGAEETVSAPATTATGTADVFKQGR